MKSTIFKFILLATFLNAHANAEEIRNKPESSGRGLGTMVLDAQFAGPFKDTLIQRWVDVSASAICYLYIPVTVPSLPNQQTVNSGEAARVYGPNSIGTISCIPAQIKPK